MPWLTQLADVARRTGYPVTEVRGWTTRGHGPQPEVQGVVCHHTAGWNDLHIVRDGRPGLDGPLSQFWLQHTGRIWVVAAGRCWHNAPSTSGHHDNSSAIGIEAENDGRRPWPQAQLDAYAALCAELCKEFGLPASRVKAHREVNTGKVDPHSINMYDFRVQVAQLIEGEPMDIDAVWHDARIKLNRGEKTEKSISPAAYLQEIETEQDRIKTRLDELHAKLDQVLAKLSA
ncbi:MAG TPA: peptidoglycan recognition family protein [Nonomuraea sp.]|nr:peptidoglycan recognition family protein [Nonomuraea sp.]